MHAYRGQTNGWRRGKYGFQNKNEGLGQILWNEIHTRHKEAKKQRSKSSRFQRSRLLSLFSMNSDRTVVQTWGPKGRRLAWWLKYHVGCPHSMKEWEVKSQPHFRFHLPANAHCGWHLVMPNVPATLMEPWTESLALSWVFVAGVRMLNQQMEALSACHCPSSSKKIKINTF